MCNDPTSVGNEAGRSCMLQLYKENPTTLFSYLYQNFLETETKLRQALCKTTNVTKYYTYTF